MSHNSDLEKVIERAKEQGWRHQRTEKGHHQFYAPDNKGIVVTGSTPSSQSAWCNFIADLKRNGYRENGLHHTLGDAMATVVSQSKPVNGGGKLTVSQYIVDLLSRHPGGLAPADIGAYISSQRPDVYKNASSVALSQLSAKGQVEKSGGLYRLATVQRPRPVPEPEPIKAIEPEPPKAVDPPRPEPPQEAAVTETAMDTDIRVLDDALNVLARLEVVLRRNRDVAKQLEALRKLLGSK